MAPSSDHPQPINGRKLPSPPAVADVAVVMVPLPAQGHLNQLLHLSRLITSYGVPVHYVAATANIHQVKLRLHGWDPSSATAKRLLRFHGFDIPPFPSPPHDPTNSATKFPVELIPAILAASSHLRHHVAALVRSLASGCRRVVVVHDSLMASTVQDTSLVSNAESYIFHSVSAFSVYWYMAEAAGLHLPPSEHGGVLLEDPPPPEGCFPAEFLKFLELQYKFRHLSSGFIYNTSRVVEGVFMEVLDKEKVHNHWAVGPFNPVRIPSPTLLAGEKPGEKPSAKHKCIEWLDLHPENSVIYVSFGSTVTLSEDQVCEIASGLENSGQRFIWVLREADRGDIFDNVASDGISGYEARKAEELSLPKGFEQRVERRGLVVREWAPQLEILGHPSVGGFLSHCGWNSCMESLSMGVPIVAWPMHSDQPSNSVLLTRILEAGLMVKEWPVLLKGGIVESSSIEKAVKALMASVEGVGIRKRAVELGKAIRRSVDDGEVSRVELDSFITHINR